MKFESHLVIMLLMYGTIYQSLIYKIVKQDSKLNQNQTKLKLNR